MRWLNTLKSTQQRVGSQSAHSTLFSGHYNKIPDEPFKGGGMDFGLVLQKRHSPLWSGPSLAWEGHSGGRHPSLAWGGMQWGCLLSYMIRRQLESRNLSWEKVFKHEPEQGLVGANQDITFLFPICCLFLPLPPES